MLLTPAFTRSASTSAVYALQYLRLAHGDADVDSVKAELSRLHQTDSFEYHFTSIDRQHARRALRPLSITLAVFGILAGVVGLVLGGLALTRLQRRELDEAVLLRAFGASPSAVTMASLIAVVATILGAAAVAATVAISLSPLMPLGPVRDVERSGGVQIDLTVIGLGLLTLALVSVIIVASTARNERAPNPRGCRASGAGVDGRRRWQRRWEPRPRSRPVCAWRCTPAPAPAASRCDR